MGSLYTQWALCTEAKLFNGHRGVPGKSRQRGGVVPIVQGGAPCSLPSPSIEEDSAREGFTLIISSPISSTLSYYC